MTNKEFVTYCTYTLAAYCLHRPMDKKEEEIISLFQDALERLDGINEAPTKQKWWEKVLSYFR